MKIISLILVALLSAPAYSQTVTVGGKVSIAGKMTSTTLSGSSAGDTLTISEVDGADQTGRPITFGRPFAVGEFPQCLQPVINAVSITDYQVDVKNRWAGGSVKYALVSFIAPAFTAGSHLDVSFTPNASCNNAGFLTKTQMVNFNSGNWGASIEVTADSVPTTVTTDAATMLGALSIADRKIEYWQQGPVVTTAIVQDATSTSAFDFGWSWDGTAMTSPVSGNASTASLHPAFILSFYPSTNTVKVDYIMENMWSGRMQDQLYNFVLKSGAALSTVYTHGVTATPRKFTNVTLVASANSVSAAGAAFTSTDVGQSIQIFVPSVGATVGTTIASVTNSTTAVLAALACAACATSTGTAWIDRQVAGTRWRKTFWSGTPSGTIRINHNFPYLISTKMLQSYDLTQTINPSVPHGSGIYGYTDFQSTDFGDIGGGGLDNLWNLSYSANNEGAPIQAEDLLYFYNMDDCGTANGRCAKAWQMLTGEKGAIDTTLSVGPGSATVTGGAGMWNNQGNVTYHMRESRTAATGQQTTTNSFYCAGFADKDSTSATACGSASGVATGRPLSRHAHSNDQYTGSLLPVTAVGTVSSGGWSVEDTSHWLDYSYVAYLLTGDYYYYEEELLGASFGLDSVNAAFGIGGGGAIWGYIYPVPGGGVRALSWGIQTVGRAAAIAVDGTVEASYYAAQTSSNLAIQEGLLGLTGTALTPSSTNSTCSAFDAGAAYNRWNFGRCVSFSQCDNSSFDCRSVGTHAQANTQYQPVPTECYSVGNFGYSQGTITAATNAAAAELTTSANPSNLGSGGNLSIWGATGTWATAGVNTAWQDTQTAANKFTIPLNSTMLGALTGTVNYSNYSLNALTVTDGVADWMTWYHILSLGHLVDIGQTQASPTFAQVSRRLIEEILDPGYNPYVASNYASPARFGVTACTNTVTSTNPVYSTWADALGGFVPFIAATPSYSSNIGGLTGNFPCADHGYSLVLRAASAMAKSLNSADASCPGGTCTGLAAWNFLGVTGGGAAPYWNNAAYQADPSGCPLSILGSQIKFSLIPR